MSIQISDNLSINAGEVINLTELQIKVNELELGLKNMAEIHDKKFEVLALGIDKLAKDINNNFEILEKNMKL